MKSYVFLSSFLLFSVTACSVALFPDFFVGGPLTLGMGNATVKIGSIKTEGNNWAEILGISGYLKLNNTYARLIKLFQDHPETELAITPEFSLYNESMPIELSCQAQSQDCEVVSSNFASIIVGLIQNLAAQNEANIILGTVAEDLDGTIYDTALIINKTGDITAVRRSGWGDDAVEKETIRTYSLDGKNGQTFTVAVVICAEVFETDRLENIYGENVDIYMSTQEFGSSLNSETTMIEIQETGDYTDTEWDVFDYVEAAGVVENEILKENGVLVFSDSGSTIEGSVIKEQAEPLEELDVDDYYVFAEAALS